MRKLNERIISAGKEAGESTLSSYESALKSIASAIEKGPGSSEIDWSGESRHGPGEVHPRRDDRLDEGGAQEAQVEVVDGGGVPPPP